MKDDFMIGIPSYKRGKHLMDHVNTLDHMDEWELSHTWLIVREEEEGAYIPVAEKYGCGIETICISPECGIPQTRDEMLRIAYEIGYKKLIMIDDDLRLDYKPNSRKYIRMTGNNKIYFRAMIESMLELCESANPVVGITARQFSDTKTAVYERNSRIIQVYCWDLKTVIEKANISFSEIGIPFMTDYYVIIRLLTLGYGNIILNRWCRDDRTQIPGGCAETRTAKSQSQCALKLAKAFPSIVTPYWKTSGTWNEKRINVRVAWRKAYKQGVKNYGEQE